MFGMAFWAVLAFAACGCNPPRATNDAQQRPAPFIPPPMVPFEEANFRVLFVGNSHTAAYDMPLIYKQLSEAQSPDRLIHVDIRTDGMFLADHAAMPQTKRALERDGWDVVVLQGQKYSTTGRYVYPTDAAEKLTAAIRARGGRVVMFPEWRRQGHKDEAGRVQKLHEALAQKTRAEVAPVGIAWDFILDAPEPIRLHANDGDHANAKGAYLTASVIFAAIHRVSPVGLPNIDRCGLSAAEVAQLQAAAEKAVATHEPDAAADHTVTDNTASEKRDSDNAAPDQPASTGTPSTQRKAGKADGDESKQ